MRPEQSFARELAQKMEAQQLPEFMQLPSINPRPSRVAVHAIAKKLQTLLFPGYFESPGECQAGYQERLEHGLAWVADEMLEQVQRGLCFRRSESYSCRVEAEEKVARFLSRLPEIRKMLAADAQAAFRGDPAAGSPEEAIFCYPGMAAVVYHRLAHELYRLEVPLIPRIIAEQAHSLTGVDIHPGASIGEGFFVDHGTGVVIGETCVIGKNVTLYQGVTLGARSFPLDADGNPIKGAPRHPILEDEVVIYSGATILGRITVGHGSMVGGNVWLTESVPPGSKITQRKARQEGFEEGGGI